MQRKRYYASKGVRRRSNRSLANAGRSIDRRELLQLALERAAMNAEASRRLGDITAAVR
jgi:hypothetical protein